VLRKLHIIAGQVGTIPAGAAEESLGKPRIKVWRTHYRIDYNINYFINYLTTCSIDCLTTYYINCLTTCCIDYYIKYEEKEMNY